MINSPKEFMKNFVKRILSLSPALSWAVNTRSYIKQVVCDLKGVYPRICSCCNFEGFFHAYGSPPRYDAKCPKCGSLERHRWLLIAEKQQKFLDNIESVLHFAPEPVIAQFLRARVKTYASADIAMPGVDFKENIESLSFNDGSYDAIVCSHILEHVDDKKAIPELYRILKPNGLLIAIVPLCWPLLNTYENPDIKDRESRQLYFGQDDHVRLYGRDFPKKLESAGFKVKELCATPELVVKHGLSYADYIFLARRT